MHQGCYKGSDSACVVETLFHLQSRMATTIDETVWSCHSSCAVLCHGPKINKTSL